MYNLSPLVVRERKAGKLKSNVDIFGETMRE